MHEQLLRIGAVREAVGLSRSQIFRLERNQNFPARVQLSANSVAWKRSEIEAWIESRVVVGRSK